MVPVMRRSVLALCALSLAGGALWWSLGRSRSEGASRRPRRRAGRPPDILFVVYDARRTDDFSFGPFGNRRGDTPFLGSFKDDAIYFPNAVAPGCWTFPVHASMFSGRSVCDLGCDLYRPGWGAFPVRFTSLAQILSRAGYRTIAYADHPFFHFRKTARSLVRGFDLFSVVMDFNRFSVQTNVDSPAGGVERRWPLEPLAAFPSGEADRLIARFNNGELRFDLEAEADHDPETGIYLARLYDLFLESDYFQRRYGNEFDRQVFSTRGRRPYLLFLNLHMCSIARPAPALLTRWTLKTLMLNAQAQGKRLMARGQAESLDALLQRNYALLGLPKRRGGPFGGTPALKQVFDNRFYDATFRRIWEYLQSRRLADDLVTIVTSDHGMSFGENGEEWLVHAGGRPYEYLTQVPLILRLNAGSRQRRLHGRHLERVSLTDLFKTVLDLSGARLGEEAQASLPRTGMSLLKRLSAGSFDRVLISECALLPFRYRRLPGVVGQSKALYAEGMKLIYAPRLFRPKKGTPYEADLHGDARFSNVDGRLALLFELASDPHEQKDLAPDRPHIVEGMTKLSPEGWDCQSLRKESLRPPEWDADTLSTLRSLGYVE